MSKMIRVEYDGSVYYADIDRDPLSIDIRDSRNRCVLCIRYMHVVPPMYVDLDVAVELLHRLLPLDVVASILRYNYLLSYKIVYDDHRYRIYKIGRDMYLLSSDDYNVLYRRYDIVRLPTYMCMYSVLLQSLESKTKCVVLPIDVSVLPLYKYRGRCIDTDISVVCVV